MQIKRDCMKFSNYIIGTSIKQFSALFSQLCTENRKNFIVASLRRAFFDLVKTIIIVEKKKRNTFIPRLNNTTFNF